MKKKWKKPKLVLLARGKPDEAVLGFCKIGLEGPWAAGPQGDGCGASWTPGDPWPPSDFEPCDTWSWT